MVSRNIICESDCWYNFGSHKLFCGDTLSDNFINVCKKESVKLAFADPPYGAELDEWDMEFSWDHDYLSDIAEIVCVTPGMRGIKEFFRSTEMPYRWGLGCYIANGHALGDIGFANWTFISIFSHSKIWRQKQDYKKITLRRDESNITRHRGQKPTELLKWVIELFTEPHDIVIDPFGGSGTTLIVCERLNRKCITGEINPEYCTEIINRWNSEPMSKIKRLENFI